MGIPTLSPASLGKSASVASAGALAAAQKLAGREFYVHVVTALGIKFQDKQHFANHWAAQEFGQDAAGEGGEIVEVSPVIEQTFMDGFNAHRHGRDCHAEATPEARMGWERREKRALAGDLENEVVKGNLPRAIADRAQRREMDMARATQLWGY